MHFVADVRAWRAPLIARSVQGGNAKNQLRQLADVGGDAPGLVAGKQLPGNCANTAAFWP
jgi:hypothetical protein